MRAAVITDAHGNLPALEAALTSINEEECDLIYHTGDAIAIGPYPAETLERLLQLPNARFIMGNHDMWFADGIPSPRPFWMSEGEEAHQRWVHEQLSPTMRQVVAGWPYSAEEEWERVRVRFCHYGLTLGENGHIAFHEIVKDPTAEDLDLIFNPDAESVVFYGHHHPASDIRGLARYVNPGALGCHTSLARFAVLECADGAYTIRHRAALYDSAPVLRELERRCVPEREFIRRVFFAS